MIAKISDEGAINCFQRCSRRDCSPDLGMPAGVSTAVLLSYYPDDFERRIDQDSLLYIWWRNGKTDSLD